PFDFTFSNNTLYFSNGNVAKAWDPVNGVRNWGIAIGSVNTSVGPNTAGNGANSGSATPWTNPNNVTSAVSFATTTLTLAPPHSDGLDATQFGFAIPAGTTITGIQVTFDAFDSTANNINVQLLKAGVATGNIKLIAMPTSVGTLNAGGSSDLWGGSWTANDTNQTNFGVEFTAFGTGGGGSTTNVRNVKITVFGLGGPAVALVAGTLTA